MIPFLKYTRRVSLAVVALSAIGMSGEAFAQNTLSGTTISNTATVNYSVSAVSQTPVSASTSFTVDTVVQFNVTGGLTTPVVPSQTNAVTVFTLTNTSNIASSFNLASTNQGGDSFDMNTPGTGTAGLIVRVDANGNGTYEPATDTATSITSLARNGSATVFIIGDTPASVVNGNTAIARLTGTAINPATSAAWVNDAGADVQGGAAQIVVGNATAFADDTYSVSTATLGVTKTSTVISDPFNGATNPKAIPLAVMEYAIAVSNTGGAAATLQSISDPIPANTTFLAGQYTGATDVRITVGASNTFCVAEAGGADTNADGCVRTVGGALSVGAPAVTTVATGSTVTVRFRVQIN